MRDSKAFSITILALCETAALALWFSASAVIPALKQEFGISAGQAALFTASVQAGFVVGALLSAVFSLADRIKPQLFFMLSTLLATAANATLLILDPTEIWVAVPRFITGLCMAGIYPVGMKIATSWAKGDMGLLVGLLVGALTIGSAFPHFFNAFGGLDWRFAIAAASVVSLGAAFAVLLVKVGPNMGRTPPFRWANAFRAWTTPSLRLANCGYLGHMWELYAMWAWLGLFLEESYRVVMSADNASFWARLATFAAMGIGGGAGSMIAGAMADRLGRTTITIWAMSISGTCALITGFLFGAPPLLLFAVCFIWGASVVADSAQFSASIAELSELDLVGTMLTMQTCLGFLLTMVTVYLASALTDAFGWGVAFATLALGPLFGIIAMARLRAHPDAVKLASGRR